MAIAQSQGKGEGGKPPGLLNLLLWEGALTAFIGK